MRFVIYDDESLEAITVLNLPLTDRDIENRGRHWRVAVPPPPLSFEQYSDGVQDIQLQFVDLMFDRFERKSHRHGTQLGWFCFTRATALAMLLNPAFLPGQRRAVDYLQDQNDSLTKMFMEVLGVWMPS